MAVALPVDLNVGGVHYTTSLETLVAVRGSLLASYFSKNSGQGGDNLAKDSQGRVFIDRDGVLFRYILDYLRNKVLILPDSFRETARLKNEAEFFRLPKLAKLLDTQSTVRVIPAAAVPDIRRHVPATEMADIAGTITIGCRGTFAFGRDGLADVKFRKLCRILVHGKVTLCRIIFGDTLNENRDVDRGDLDRYSGRFYLKHNFLEQAFDSLLNAGFELKGCCGSGTNAPPTATWQQPPGAPPIAGFKSLPPSSEEDKWFHYNEFIWIKQI